MQSDIVSKKYYRQPPRTCIIRSCHEISSNCYLKQTSLWKHCLTYELMPFGDIPCQIALLQCRYLPIFMMPCLPVMPIMIIEVPVIRLRCIRIRHWFIKLNILVIRSVIMFMHIINPHSFPGWCMVYVITWPYIYQPFFPLVGIVFSVFDRRCVICRILPRFPRNHTFLKHSNVNIIASN